MCIKRIHLLFLCFLSSCFPLRGNDVYPLEPAIDTVCNASLCRSAHRVRGGPEMYQVIRTREGGTRQHGMLYGGRFIYDHYKRYRFYWAAEAAYALGTLRGYTGNGGTLKSRMTDASVEARFGYTFQCKSCWQLALTPFAGIGYLWECNNFTHPSLLSLHFKTQYRYATVGFLLAISPTEQFTAGLNVKGRYLLNPKCRISNDPEFKAIRLGINNDQLQYRIELPLTYLGKDSYWSVQAVPFYERRFYGRYADHPFDFLETQLINYGVTLMFGIQL